MLNILIGVVVVLLIAVSAVALGGRKRRSGTRLQSETSVTFPPAADEIAPGKSAIASSDKVEPTTPAA